MEASEAAGPNNVVDITSASLGGAARRAIQERASPEGIVTILFTDIVDSTRLRQRLGDDVAQQRFRRHNQLVRAEIAKHGGYEVKTYGDGFMVAFTDPAAAIACALGIQRAIASENRAHPAGEIQMRIGLNCGQAIREEEDFFGSAVVAAARVADLAKSGQILTTETVRGLAGSRRGVRYVDAGRRTLKGLEGRYHIWAVPWEEGAVEAARLWRIAVLGMGAAAVILLGVGGTLGGLFASGALGGGDGGVTITYQPISLHYVVELHADRESGDCVIDDIAYAGRGIGRTTGDIAGTIALSQRATIYVKEKCQLGAAASPFVISDNRGNTLEGESESIFSITRLLEGEAGAGRIESAVVVTGGSGIYQGATGYGTCASLSVNKYNADGSVDAHADADCDVQIRPGTAGPAEPLTLRGIGSSPEVTVFASPLDLPKTLYVVVLYRNNTDEMQTGLRLSVPAPAGVEVKMSVADESQAPAGARVWDLPDLAPATVGRFKFLVDVLSADVPSLTLAPQIVGDGLEGPFRSDPITATILQ